GITATVASDRELSTMAVELHFMSPAFACWRSVVLRRKRMCGVCGKSRFHAGTRLAFALVYRCVNSNSVEPAAHLFVPLKSADDMLNQPNRDDTNRGERARTPESDEHNPTPPEYIGPYDLRPNETD